MKNRKLYPLTYPQKGIWYTEKLYNGTSINIISGTLKIKGDIDFRLLEKVINLIIEKNDALRIRIMGKDGEAKQYICEYEYGKIDFLDFRKKDLNDMYNWESEKSREPINIIESDLFYFAMIKVNDTEAGVYIKMHHLICDAWTMIHICNNIIKYYNCLKSGSRIINDKEPSYIEYVEREEEYIKSKRYEKDRAFWLEKFKDIPDPTILKTPKKNNKKSESARKTFMLPDKLCNKIRRYCDETKSSIFGLFLYALSIYINRVTSKTDIVLGAPVLNRRNAREKNIMGMFISTVPLRIKIEDELSFKDFSEKVSREWISVLKHQLYPYDLLLKEVRKRNKSIITGNLYDIVLSYQNAKFIKDDISSDSKYSRWHFNGHQVESLYIHINDREDDGSIVLDYDFLKDLFYEKEIDFIHDHIIRLLWHALDDPGKKLCNVEMISENEKNKILYEFNNTKAGYPEDKTVHQIFESQVKKRSGKTALIYENKKMTYKRLNERTNQVAGIIRSKGVKADDIVGILINRSFEMVIGMLAVLKAGGAYMPIDPEYPDDRINYMLADSKAKVLLTGSLFEGRVDFEGHVIDLCDEASSGKGCKNLPNINKPNDLAYIIYTSGSTGRPKGVMIEHKNVVRLLFNDKFMFDFNQNDIWTLFHSYCFDFSVWEMYGALLYGGKLIIVPKLAARDPEKFTKLIQAHKVTVLNQTPSAFYNLLDIALKSNKIKIRYIIFGGEALNPLMLKSFIEKYPHIKLVNMYGITETTVHVTFKEITGEDIESGLSNIGKAIPTLKTYILDSHLNLLPIGMTGELYVSGDGVCRGYLNKPELTKERFVENPYFSGERMYKSGDLARWYARGDMEYCGRIDHQVKIRGHRIELGEVENNLLKHDKIRKAVVIDKESRDGQKQLIAYIECDKGLSIINLRNFLSKQLPDYMVPASFIRVENIPLTSNGKVNRKLLPEQDNSLSLGNKYVAPRNKTEKALVNIWSEVLGVENIGIDDNYFDLGGDSLSAIKIISKIDNNVNFADLYNNPTVKMLSHYIRKNVITAGNLLIKISGSDKGGINVICFPYGGGSSFIYKDLGDTLCDLSDRYSVYSINFPDYNIYPRRRKYIYIKEIAKQLVKEILEGVHGDIILYGHCIGSALEIEVARYLELHNRKVLSVCIGGAFPPRFAKYLGDLSNPWNFIPDNHIIKILNMFGLEKCTFEEQEKRYMIKAFRRDVKYYYQYFYSLSKQRAFKLNAPIYCIIGDVDLLTKKSKIHYKRWYRFSNDVKLHILKNANHYFIKTHHETLTKILLDIR